MNLQGEKSQIGKKKTLNPVWFHFWYFFFLFLLECKLLIFSPPWETSQRQEGSHVVTVQTVLQPLQHSHYCCSKASGQATRSHLSAKQQLLLGMVQSPVKITGTSALTAVTFGSNPLKYQCYMPAARHWRNTALCWKKWRSYRFAFFFAFKKNPTEYVLANICCMIRNSSFFFFPSLFPCVRGKAKARTESWSCRCNPAKRLEWEDAYTCVEFHWSRGAVGSAYAALSASANITALFYSSCWFKIYPRNEYKQQNTNSALQSMHHTWINLFKSLTRTDQDTTWSQKQPCHGDCFNAWHFIVFLTSIVLNRIFF